MKKVIYKFLLVKQHWRYSHILKKLHSPRTRPRNLCVKRSNARCILSADKAKSGRKNSRKTWAAKILPRSWSEKEKAQSSTTGADEYVSEQELADKQAHRQWDTLGRMSDLERGSRVLTRIPAVSRTFSRGRLSSSPDWVIVNFDLLKRKNCGKAFIIMRQL